MRLSQQSFLFKKPTVAREEPGNTVAVASYCDTLEGGNSLTKMISANVPVVWTVTIDNTLCPGTYPVPFCHKYIERIPDNHYIGAKLDRTLEGECCWSTCMHSGSAETLD